MNCNHCLAWNSAESHRCHRCGRRHAGSAHAASKQYPIQTATALAYAFADGQPQVAVLESPKRLVYQKHLFDPQVVQLPMSHAAANTTTRHKSTTRLSARRYHPAQQAFSFDSESQEPETTEARLPDGIYCDSPVAQPIHRLMAAALDSSMIVIALALFLITFHVCGGIVVFNSKTAALYAGIYAVLWFFYKGLYSVCGSDTPGMLWTDLKLVNFDGETPDREQRIFRMVGGVLGLLSAGLGLVWSLVDEEQLTWHDHISKTFPSPQKF